MGEKARPLVSVWECIRAKSSVLAVYHCIEALSGEFKKDYPWKLLYTDELVLVAETEELLMGKVA